jgi:predicted RNase H-like HicB family nuclease
MEIRFCLTVIFVPDEASSGYVGHLKEIPAVCSQGETLIELKENLLDALKLLCEC